jgi:hypothetical protein
MAVKLKSIVRPIPWFLLLKAVLFGLGWLILPSWLFVLSGLFLYLVPFFQPRKLLVPFLSTLALSLILPYDPGWAVFFAGVSFLIFGIKDLIFINRSSAYEFLTLLLVFGAIFSAFSSGAASWHGFAFLAMGVIAALFVAFVLELLRYKSSDMLIEGSQRRSLEHKAIFISGFLLWQLGIGVAFLPLNLFYQTALLFLVAALMLELIVDWSEGDLSPRTLLFHFSVFFVFAVLLFASAEWGL